MSKAVASRESSLRQTNEQLAAEIGERKHAEEAYVSMKSVLNLPPVRGILYLGLGCRQNVMTWTKACSSYTGFAKRTSARL